MAEFRLKRGYDIRLVGEPAATVVPAPVSRTIAVHPAEFRGIVPRPVVQVGDRVKAGSPLFVSKANEAHRFTSPQSGTVKDVIRGARRKLLSILVDVDDEQVSETYKTYDAAALRGLSREVVLEALLKSGLLAQFRQRPFDHVAKPEVVPRDIFVQGFDSAPLAADSTLMLRGNESFFQAGLDLANCLTGGTVHLCLDGRLRRVPAAFGHAKNVEIHYFRGPHPSGCVGVQIHHIAPIRHRRDAVWYIDVQGLIRLGKLFLNGTIDAQQIVAVTGSAAKDRQHFRTVVGASVAALVGGKVDNGELRYIAGNVLTGTTVDPQGYLGQYDTQLTIIPEATEPEFIGWMLPGFNRLSKYRVYLSALIPFRRYVVDTKLNGGRRAFVATGHYESVLPMDIYPLQLIKSIMAEDFEEMEGLGIYEVCEDELALCEYICPSKSEMQKTLRHGLDLIEREG